MPNIQKKYKKLPKVQKNIVGKNMLKWKKSAKNMLKNSKKMLKMKNLVN